jgi:hypothetical protein
MPTTTKVKSAARAVWERPKYFPRQVVTADDLTLEQDYFRNRLRMHNRMLHGYGVVCGAIVTAAAEPWHVKITRGYILTPYGDDVHIERDICFDIRKRCENTQGTQPCPPPSDPWCTDPIEPLEENKAFVIAVRYVESPRRAVRVSPAGCGCESSSCEYSRWQDGYEVCTLDECPASHQNPPDFDAMRRGEPPPCPECPEDPWVVLAEVRPDREGKVTVGTCTCRRQVLSFARYWWKCEHAL